MEATNISIKQQSSVSINVETWLAIKQHLWLRVKGAWFMVHGSMSLPRLYHAGAAPDSRRGCMV